MRPKGSTNKSKDVQEVVKEVIKEIIVEKVVEVEKPLLKSLALYKELAKLGFPQGGSGNMMLDPNSNEQYYVPLPSEIYAQMTNDPQDWDKVRDALARCFIDKNKK